MEYRIKELAELSGVSERTLRYYDQIGLLRPRREANGYRVYDTPQVDRLQEILFCRQMGMELEQIRRMLEAPEHDRQTMLERHLQNLLLRHNELDRQIAHVQHTLRAWRGEETMTDQQKFEGFKQKMIRENEEKYGREVEERYGREALEASNQKMTGMTQAQWEQQQELNERIFVLLEQAMKKDDPACEEAQQAADAHRQWLCLFWKDGMYSPAAHRGMAETYVADERFAAYYNQRLGEGGAAFLRDAIRIYTKA